MKRKNRPLVPVAAAVMGVLVMGILGCGEIRYKLILGNSGLESKKSGYAAGEEVTVYYKYVATDTDYRFYADTDDVSLSTSYDGEHGYVMTFNMPEHDVKIDVDSRNTMEYDPGAHLPDIPDNIREEIKDESMLFDYIEKTMATVGGDGYTEYVLYERDNGYGTILVKYTKEDGDEEHAQACLVPDETWDQCMNIVRSCKMEEWDKGHGLKGKYYAVRFAKDGKTVRVSSDEMPEDGMDAFSLIEDILGEAFGTYGPGIVISDDGAAGSGDNGAQTAAGMWFCDECGTPNEGAYCAECGKKRPEGK